MAFFPLSKPGHGVEEKAIQIKNKRKQTRFMFECVVTVVADEESSWREQNSSE